MTPSNPSNQNPFILCIMDALGIPHQVAPLEHTHSYADIPGLADELGELWAGMNEKASQEAMTEALAAKQNVLTFDSTPTANSTNPVTSGGVKTALDSKAPVSHSHNSISGDGYMVSMSEDGVGISVNGEDEVFINESNIDNLARALHTPDAQPTDNSDNLVTSGAVAAALRNATRMRQSINIPGFTVTELEKGIVYSYIFTNTSGESISLNSCFDTSSLPVSERNLFVTENGEGVTINDGDVFGARICRLDEGVFVEYLGLFV